MQFYKEWLLNNKITPEVQKEFGLNFKDHIIIPVHDFDGNFLFNKYRRSPLKEDGPKYWYDKGSKVTLYGWWKAKNHDTILITEGEKDCLVAWSHNIPAVTSTGGANSFQKEWGELFKGVIEDIPATANSIGLYVNNPKEVILCFDNDHAGAEGLVRTLEIIPWAKILLLPDQPNVKDISDYVNHGGNLHELIKTARHFNFLEEVEEDSLARLALFKSTFFHDAYIKAHKKVNTAPVEKRKFDNDKVTNAKLYPIPNLLKFTSQNKAICPFHKEKTPSLVYYPKDNHCFCFGQCGRMFDAIDIYRKLNNASFKEAVDNLQK